MNTLLVGTDKTFTVDFSAPALVIDDGSVIDGLDIPRKTKITHFDISKHCLNPLQGMNYQRAREFIAILDAIFPEGENTLTKKNANFVLLTALLNKPTTLHKLVAPDPKAPAKQDAYQKIQTLLFSPVLRSVLRNSERTRLDGVVLARLDRAEIGDFDAFVIAAFLVSQFKGHVIIPDFGFYGRDFHMPLIRQNRLTAGVNFLAEVRSDALRQALLTFPQKIGCGATYEDAVVLANHAGKRPDPQKQDSDYNRFLDEAMGLV